MDQSRDREANKIGIKSSAMVNSELKLPVKPSPDHPGRSTNQLKYLFRGVLPALFKLRVAQTFKESFDPDLQYPVHLLVIRERLRYNYYWSSLDCIKDFQRMICNVLIYCKMDSDAVAKANHLEAAFLEKLIDMPTEEVEGLDWKPTNVTKVAVNDRPSENGVIQDVQPSIRNKRIVKPVIKYSPPATVSRIVKKKVSPSSSSSCSSSSDSNEKLSKTEIRDKEPKILAKTNGKAIHKPKPKQLKMEPKSRQEEEEEVNQMIGKLKVNDLMTLMGILNTDEEIDVGKLEPMMFEEVKRFVTSKMAKGRYAESSSSCPSSPDICDPRGYQRSFPAVCTVTETLKSSDTEQPFYDSEDELLLSTY